MRGLTQFEHRRQKVVSRMAFAKRMVWVLGIWFAATLSWLIIGMIGYGKRRTWVRLTPLSTRP